MVGQINCPTSLGISPAGSAKGTPLALRASLRQRGREEFFLTQHLPLQRALRALGHAGLTSRRAYGAGIRVITGLSARSFIAL